MNLLQIRLSQIKNDISLAKNYAGRFKGNQFYRCKKCLGKGYKEYDYPTRVEICPCVVKNIQLELADSQKRD